MYTKSEFPVFTPQDKFHRNRENKIKIAMKQFRESNNKISLPAFMKGYKEFREIKDITKKLRKMRESILSKASEDISERNLVADQCIREIFERSEPIATSVDLYHQAQQRVAVGNPPGKNNSIGDAINWLILLEHVPAKQDIHVISADGDFYSQLDEDMVNPFLADEWHQNKKSKIYVYRNVSAFLNKHFDGIGFSYDANKDKSIDRLAKTRSFAESHEVISDLDAYTYYSLAEVQRILDAILDNDQVSQILTDYDVSDFLHRVGRIHRQELTKNEHLDILDTIQDEQIERARIV